MGANARRHLPPAFDLRPLLSKTIVFFEMSMFHQRRLHPPPLRLQALRFPLQPLRLQLPTSSFLPRRRRETFHREFHINVQIPTPVPSPASLVPGSWRPTAAEEFLVTKVIMLPSLTPSSTREDGEED
eukprot:2970676-Pyramimonas_sp.AAC.1